MNILAFAPHPDDEIIGCGGTLARHVADGDRVTVCVATRGLPPVYNHPQAVIDGLPHDLAHEIEAVHRLLGVAKTVYLGFPAVMLETVPRYQLNRAVDTVVDEVRPDIVYLPHPGDLQKDHGVLTDAVMVALRPKAVRAVRTAYAYETLSETEWGLPGAASAFIPNTFVDITPYLPLKLRLMEGYASQLAAFPNPRSLEAVQALARVRGSTMGAEAAEAFALVREYRWVTP